MSARPAASGGAAARRAAIALCTDPEGWCWGGSEQQAADAERGLSVLLFVFFLSFFSLFFFYSFFFFHRSAIGRIWLEGSASTAVIRKQTH